MSIWSANGTMDNKESIKRDSVFKKVLRHNVRILPRLGHLEIFSSRKSTHNWQIKVLLETLEMTMEFLIRLSSIWAKTLNLVPSDFHCDITIPLWFLLYSSFWALSCRLKFLEGSDYVLYFSKIHFLRNYHSVSLKSNGLMPAFMMTLKCMQWKDIFALLLLIRILRDRREVTTLNQW